MVHERRGCTLLIPTNLKVWGLNVDDWRKEQGVLQKDAHDSPRRRNLPPPARKDLGPCPIGLESGKTSVYLGEHKPKHAPSQPTPISASWLQYTCEVEGGC